MKYITNTTKRLDNTPKLLRADEIKSQLKKLMSENSRLRKEIKDLKIDPLTGLNNRNGGEEALEAEINRFLRSKTNDGAISMIFIDGDNIKAINDKYGHIVGDMVIKVIAKSIKKSQRDYDTSYRYGGDEFIVILPDTDEMGVSSFIKRISESLKKEIRKIPSGKIDRINVSISYGHHTLRHGEAHDVDSAIEILLKKSDKMMYKNKNKKKIQ